jgi:hypothetical protein
MRLSVILPMAASLIVTSLFFAASTGPATALTAKQCRADAGNCIDDCDSSIRHMPGNRGAHGKCTDGCIAKAGDCMKNASDRARSGGTK